MKKDSFEKGVENIVDGAIEIIEERIDDIDKTKGTIISGGRITLNFFTKAYLISRKYFIKNWKEGIWHFITFLVLYIYLLWFILVSIVYLFTIGNIELSIGNLWNYRVRNTVLDFINRQPNDYRVLLDLNEAYTSEKEISYLKSLSLFLLEKYNQNIEDIIKDGYVFNEEKNSFLNESSIKSFLGDNSKIRVNKAEVVKLTNEDELGIIKVIVSGKAVVFINGDKDTNTIDYLGEFNLKKKGFIDGYIIQDYKYIQICGANVQENIVMKCK